MEETIPSTSADTKNSSDETLHDKVSTSAPKNDLETFRRLADRGDAESQYRVGLCYYDGVGGAVQNDTLAVQWFERAAQQHHSKAQYGLGACHELGHGVPQRNKEEATKQYHLAFPQLQILAENPINDAEAQRMLGQAYYWARGTQRNWSLAARWWIKSSEQGDIKAMKNLSICYHKGQGVPRDPGLGLQWNMAANGGPIPSNNKNQLSASASVPQRSQSSSTTSASAPKTKQANKGIQQEHSQAKQQPSKSSSSGNCGSSSMDFLLKMIHNQSSEALEAEECEIRQAAFDGSAYDRNKAMDEVAGSTGEKMTKHQRNMDVLTSRSRLEGNMAANMGLRQGANETIIKYIRDGTIAFLSVDWLIKMCDDDGGEKLRLLPRRQDLPKEAFMQYKDMSYGTSDIVVLSYMWMSPEHPDPYGKTLELVVKALKLLQKDMLVKRTLALFWDFASLHQKPRTKDEDVTFSNGLDLIPFIFMHHNTKVLRVAAFPPDFQPVGHSGKSSFKRGWPSAETSWCSLIKGPTSYIYDIGKLWQTKDPSTAEEWTTLSGCKAEKMQVPLLPDLFDSHADTLSFVNGKDDRPLIKFYYRKAFQTGLSVATDLDFNNMEDTDENRTRLLDLLRFSPQIQYLSCVRSAFSSEMVQRLAKERLPSLLQLVNLNLSHNPKIGDDGVLALCPCLWNMHSVYLKDVGLSSNGCHKLVETFVESGSKVSLQQLDLSENNLGDDGVVALASVLVQIKKVELRSVGTTIEGHDFLKSLEHAEDSLLE